MRRWDRRFNNVLIAAAGTRKYQQRNKVIEKILTAREHIKLRKSVWHRAICGSSINNDQHSHSRGQSHGVTETQKSGLDSLRLMSNSCPME
jgi:hypothetical protein